MRVMQLALLVLVHAARDVGKAEAAAVPVVQSLLSWVQKTKSSAHELHDHFASWCATTAAAQGKLRDETTRRVQDGERKLKQMQEDAGRVESTRKLITTATNSTAPKGLAVTALNDMQEQVKSETDFLVRAQELAGHALHLATLSSDPDAGAADGLESSGDGVVALLSQILHEADLQRAAVGQEKESLATLFSSFTQTDSAAATLLGDEVQELDSEARARVRTTARLSSELADLRRVVSAASLAQNQTAEICTQQAAATSDKEERRDSADEWAVRSALDQLSPEAPPNFLQVRASVRTTSRAARFAAGLVQMAHHHTNPALEQAAQALEKKDTELSVATLSPEGKAIGDPLAEIAAFSEGETADASTTLAKDAYTGMRANLNAELEKLKAEEARCQEAQAAAASGQTVVEKTAQKNAAMLKVASSLTEEREHDVNFLQTQVAELKAARAQLQTLEDEEKAEFKTLTDYSKDAPVQLYSVATDLTAAGNPKVGTALESLVNMLQKRTQVAEKQHGAFTTWTQQLETSLADLERALTIDAAHTTRRARDSEAEKTYRASMAASAAQGQDAALAVRSDAAACASGAQDLSAKRASAEEQLQQLDGLWSHVQAEPDFA